jgi:hypothetical protein
MEFFTLSIADPTQASSDEQTFTMEVRQHGMESASRYDCLRDDSFHPSLDYGIQTNAKQDFTQQQKQEPKDSRARTECRIVNSTFPW